MDKLKLWYYAQPVAIRSLLAVNVVVYLLWSLLLVHFSTTASFVYSYLALNPSIPEIVFRPWQLVTYSFLHLGLGFGGFLHILFNMLWMMWIGRDFEAVYGSSRLLALYLIGAVGGGLMTVVLHAIFPGIGSFGGIVHGASGAVLCIMMAAAITTPTKSVALLFIGVVRLLHVVIGFLLLDLLWSAGGGTSISAHWGGALAGFLLARAHHAGLDYSAWAAPLFRRSSTKNYGSTLARLEGWLATRQSGEPASPESVGTQGGENSNESNLRGDADTQAEIDAILDKISEKGYEALTDTEKRKLYKAGE